MYSSKENLNILTALLVSHQVRHIVVCPGSRNAPLVHNFNEHPDIVCHPVTDERSAGFVALGLRQQLAEPVAVCVTSGSALLNLLPAVAEATYRNLGIIVISADRPAAWLGQLDGQTLPQADALGSFAAMSVNVVEVHNARERWMCNRIINDALMENERPSHPSVHINVQLSEPLFDFGCASLPEERTSVRLYWSSAAVRQTIIDRLHSSRKPMLVVGQLPKESLPSEALRNLSEKIAVLAGPLSCDDSASFADQAVYLIQNGRISDASSYIPDCVVFAGGNTVSKRLRHFLREQCRDAFHISVSVDGVFHDVSCHTSIVIEAEPSCFLSDLESGLEAGSNASFAALWNSLGGVIARRHASFRPAYSQMLAVKTLEGVVRSCDVVHYANSMSVRLAAVYASHYCWCNRGLNGIEGSLSTAAGAAAALSFCESMQSCGGTPPRLYCITGDLSFFYDQNALWPAGLGGNFRIMLLNNGGGGIFKGLDGLYDSPAADDYVAGAHKITAEGVCRSFGLKYLTATDDESLLSGIAELSSLESDRPVLLEVITDRQNDHKVYSEYFKHLENDN